MVGVQGGGEVRQVFTFITGMLECLFFAGIIFGWASLVFLLKSRGFFGSFCVNTTNNCRGQDEQFSLVFTIASFMNNFLTFLNGVIFDRFGTLVDALCPDLCVSPSALSMVLYPALSFIAVGGMMLLLSNMQVANLFGAHRSTIITIYNGAFDSSSGVFVLVKLAYESGIPLKASFLFLATGSIYHILRTIFLFPRTSIPYPPPDHYKYGKSNKTVQSDFQMPVEEKPHDVEEPERPGVCNYELLKQRLQRNHVFIYQMPCFPSEKTFRECVLSKFFFFVVLWLSVIQLRHYLFIGTLNPMLERLADGDASVVSQYINAFAFTQMCGLLVAPMNGFILDRHKRKPPVAGMSEREADLNSAVLSFFLTSLVSLIFSICASIPVLPLQYFTFIALMVNYSFVYGGMAAFVAMTFPPCHFGKLYGFIFGLSAVFSLLQYACFAVVEELLDGDPLYMNIGLTILILFSFSHPLNVFLHCRALASQRAKANKITDMTTESQLLKEPL
uniref:Solute carrier family 43 member 3b n=2 Tax=Hippocampus comes TaxID=109280 RepID=A0A3Q2YUB8_HIPCM